MQFHQQETDIWPTEMPSGPIRQALRDLIRPLSALSSGVPIISSLTSVVSDNRLPWNDIQGLSQRNHTENGGAAKGRPTILTTFSLALALDFIPRQPVTVDYLLMSDY